MDNTGQAAIEAGAVISRRAYLLFNIATGLLKGAALVAIVFWLLPLFGVHVPVWGLILIAIAFGTYEVVTFRLGRRALERKSQTSPQAIIGCSGQAATPLVPAGYVRVNGELWRALAADENISKGDDIVVLELDRLTLRVAPLEGVERGNL